MSLGPKHCMSKIIDKIFLLNSCVPSIFSSSKVKIQLNEAKLEIIYWVGLFLTPFIVNQAILKSSANKHH